MMKRLEILALVSACTSEPAIVTTTFDVQAVTLEPAQSARYQLHASVLSDSPRELFGALRASVWLKRADDAVYDGVTVRLAANDDPAEIDEQVWHRNVNPNAYTIVEIWPWTQCTQQTCRSNATLEIVHSSHDRIWLFGQLALSAELGEDVDQVPMLTIEPVEIVP